MPTGADDTVREDIVAFLRELNNKNKGFKSPEEAFAEAKAQCPSNMVEFLKTYRDLTGRQDKDVQEAEGVVTVSARYKGELISAGVFERIIETNSYLFPTDDQGNVRPDIVEFLRSINHRRTMLHR